jgi:hypothetical protein
MAFFTTSTGEAIEASNTYEVARFQALIPDGTKLLTNIVSAEWVEATDFNNESVKIGLFVVEPGNYYEYVVYDNLRVNDKNPKKADKAIVKLMTYDTLCKGLLSKADNAGKDISGDNNLLEKALNGGEILATFDVWEMEGKDGVMRSGNWVSKIEPAPKKVRQENKRIEEMAKNISEYEEFDGEEIPF